MVPSTRRYARAYIERWIEDKGPGATSPITNLRLAHHCLNPNRDMKSRLVAFFEKHPDLAPTEPRARLPPASRRRADTAAAATAQQGNVRLRYCFLRTACHGGIACPASSTSINGL